MKQEHLWEIFQKTGKVEDYLRYCGVASSAADNTVADYRTGVTHHEADHRRTDRAGKQHHR